MDESNKDALDTRTKILYAAKYDFLENGFTQANVRTIAQKAGVTTGAVYNLFKNKDGIFEALIGNVFDQFLNIITHRALLEAKSTYMTTDPLATITEVSRLRFLKMIDFFYDNWDVMKLIVCCAKGSSSEHIFDRAVDLIESETIRLLEYDNVKISQRIRFFIHVMVTAHFENLKEIFYHDLKKQEAIDYALDFNVYHCAGWKQYWLEQTKP